MKPKIDPLKGKEKKCTYGGAHLDPKGQRVSHNRY